MKLTLKPIPVNYVAQAWPLVEQYIADSQSHSGDDFTVDQVRLYVSTGQWLLILVVDELEQIHGAVTVSFINSPNARIGFVTNLGGRLIVNRDTIEQLKSIAKSHGATKMQATTRESMTRLLKMLGFYERYKVVEAKL
jgi:hypothetical protein